jgi:hypothetical protein
MDEFLTVAEVADLLKLNQQSVRIRVTHSPYFCLTAIWRAT